MRFTGDEHPSSVHITHIQRQFMAEVEKENEQVYNNKLDDGHSALEQEEQDDDEDDDDMRITEQLEVEASTSYQYRSPHRMPLDDITDNIQTSLQPLSFENVPNVYVKTIFFPFKK
jgi:protein subunit release factor B